MANKEDIKKPDDVRVEIVTPRGGPVQPANNFVVAFTNDEFALDSIYVHPFDLHIAKQKAEGERKAPGTLVGRIALVIPMPLN